MTIKGKKVSLEEISQEIDLKEYLGEKPTAEQKRIFAELAKDLIQDRTIAGYDVTGKKFTRYTEEYAKEKGVSRNSVDLFLKGNMLESIGRRKSKEKANTVFIQMKKGLQTKKSFNHDTGDTLPRREFFGITKKEAEDIAKEIKSLTEAKEERRVTLADLQLAAAALLATEDEDENGES